MISFQQAKKLALKEKKGQRITNAVRYRDYYVFFMQPEGVNPDSDDAVMDNYVIVDFMSENVEYKSIFSFNDFFDKAVLVK